MFSHTKRRYCKFFDYWKYSLKDGTYFAKDTIHKAIESKDRRRAIYKYHKSKLNPVYLHDRNKKAIVDSIEGIKLEKVRLKTLLIDRINCLKRILHFW